MKTLNPILLLSILILILSSCSSGWHIGTGDKRTNLIHWKQDRIDKKEAKKNAKLKKEL